MKKTFEINLRVNLSFVTYFLGAIILFCIFMALLRGLIIYLTGVNDENGLLMKFNMDFELTLPAYVSTVNLLLSSALLAVVTNFKRSVGDRFWMHWGLLSLGFLLLSIDESISIHEMMVGAFVLDLFNISGPGNFGVGILILFCASISGLFFFRFILHLPKRTQLRFLIAGAIYLLGAAGMEAVGGYFLADGYQVVPYNIAVIVEESMEMVGILLFIRAILHYIIENLVGINSLLKEEDEPTSATVPGQKGSLVPEKNSIEAY